MDNPIKIPGFAPVNPGGNQYYELPKVVITDNPITKKYGFEVFKSGNRADVRLYVVLPLKTVMIFEEQYNDAGYIEYIIKQYS